MSVGAFVYPQAERNLGVTDKLKLGIVGDNQCYSSANTAASAHKPTHVKLPNKNQSQPFGKHIAANVKKSAKNCQETWPDGSVAGVVMEKPDMLSNHRFHVLQHLDVSDPFVADTNATDSLQNIRGCMN